MKKVIEKLVDLFVVNLLCAGITIVAKATWEYLGIREVLSKRRARKESSKYATLGKEDIES